MAAGRHKRPSQAKQLREVHFVEEVGGALVDAAGVAMAANPVADITISIPKDFYNELVMMDVQVYHDTVGGPGAQGIEDSTWADFVEAMDNARKLKTSYKVTLNDRAQQYFLEDVGVIKRWLPEWEERTEGDYYDKEYRAQNRKFVRAANKLYAQVEEHRRNMAANPHIPSTLSNLLAAMRASYLVYREGHWTVEGDSFYGNHLLLERIYDETKDQIDRLAEQMVGTYGNIVESRDIQEWKDRFLVDSRGDPMQASLDAAAEVRRLLAIAYRNLKHENQLTLGWDDLLMALSQEKDSHIYLLQQATGAKAPPVEIRKLRSKLLR